MLSKRMLENWDFFKHYALAKIHRLYILDGKCWIYSKNNFQKPFIMLNILVKVTNDSVWKSKLF